MNKNKKKELENICVLLVHIKNPLGSPLQTRVFTIIKIIERLIHTVTWYRYT